VPRMRIRFTAEDLLLTRFVTRPAPLLELSMSIATVQRRDPLFARMSYAGPMTEFVRPNGTAPLFMDPMSVGMADGLDRVRSTPRDYARSQLRLFPATTGARALYNFDRDAWRALPEALTTAHAALVQPNWERRCLGLRGDVAWRGQVIAEEGIKAALCTLVPGTEWRSSTLHVPAARDRDLELGGRGLVLYPCVGWTGHVMFGYSSDGARCLFYPALTPLPLVEESGDGNPIAELLGRTRAAVLQAAAEPQTTAGLARELGISAASVSAHTKTLRAAGLLTSQRAGKAVFHSVSPLGHRLLARHLPPEPVGHAPTRSSPISVGPLTISPLATSPASVHRPLHGLSVRSGRG
jgi:DNA-binding MarR family transcriptional regulator